MHECLSFAIYLIVKSNKIENLQSVRGELSPQQTVNQIYLQAAVQQIENFTAEKLQAIQRVPSPVVVEVVSNGDLVLPPHVLVDCGGDDAGEKPLYPPALTGLPEQVGGIEGHGLDKQRHPHPLVVTVEHTRPCKKAIVSHLQDLSVML